METLSHTTLKLRRIIANHYYAIYYSKGKIMNTLWMFMRKKNKKSSMLAPAGWNMSSDWYEYNIDILTKKKLNLNLIFIILEININSQKAKLHDNNLRY